MAAQALEALADLLGVLGHPDRIALLLALRDGERDVAHLAAQAALPQARTSQHLALLRAHHIVASRKDGRRALYRVTQPGLVSWVTQGAAFLVEDAARQEALATSLRMLLDPT